MKKCTIMLIVLLLIIVFLIGGCTQKKGYIIRNDITMKDLEFVYEGTEQRMDVTISEMYGALGLPYSTSGYSVTEYNYRIEEGTVQLKFNNKQFIGARFYLPNDIPEPTPFEIGAVEIDQNKYMMGIRDDISESEISFINEATTSAEVQEKLGAPHGGISHWDAATITDVYFYELDSGNTLRITYERFGMILQAWIEDKNGEKTEVMVESE